MISSGEILEGRQSSVDDNPMGSFVPFKPHGPEIVEPGSAVPFGFPFWPVLLRGGFGADTPISTVHKGLAGPWVVDQLMSVPSLRLLDVTILRSRCSRQDPNPLSRTILVPVNPLWDVQPQLRLRAGPCSCPS